MKKILTKTLSLVLCVAFAGMQTSLAAVLTTGDFAGRQVLNGTGAIIKGHTAGLRAVETDLTNATLRFNNHTRIDWDKLNVDKGQKLYFNNGSYGVLNNVVGTSISKFAGSITADNAGKIIISNPNGMLFQGGKFTSTGAGLLLTTKDLTGDAYGEGYNFNNLSIDNANNGSNTFQVIQLLGDSEGNRTVIEAGEIAIVSNGVLINGADLSSTMSNGVVLVTADGANFAANVPNNNGMRISNEYGFEVVANSAISTNNGTITLKSGRGETLQNSTFDGNTVIDAQTRVATVGKVAVDGNLDVNADYIQMAASNDRSTVSGNMTFTDKTDSVNTYGAKIRTVDIDGDLTVNTPSNVELTSVKAGTTKVDTQNEVRISDVQLGDTTVNSTNFTRICGDNEINGDLTVSASQINMGSYENENRNITHGTTNVTGTYKANAKLEIGFSDHINADKIDFTSETSSILNANSEGWNGTLKANDIKLSAKKGEITSVNADLNHESPVYVSYGVPKVDENGNTVTTPSSDYYDLMQDGTFDTLQSYNRSHVDLQGGNATVEAKGAVALRTDLTGDLNVNTERGITLLDSTVGGNTELTSDSIQIREGANKFGGDLKITDYTSGNAQQNSVNVSLNNVEVAGNLEITSPDFIRVINTKANTDHGTTNINTTNEVRVGNVELGTTDIKTNKFVRMYGENQINGDLTVEGSQVNFGTYSNDSYSVVAGNKTTVTGDLKSTSTLNTGISSALKAKNVDIEAKTESVITADGFGSIEGETVKLTANKGSILSVDATNNGSSVSDYVTAMRYDAGTNALSALKTGNVDVKGGSATLTAKNNIGVNADLTGDLNATGGAILDNYINVTGKVGGDLNTSVDDTHISNATVGGNVLAIDSFDNPDDTKGVTITDSTITGSLTRPNDWDNVKVHGTTAGDTTLRGADIEVKDSNVANLDTYTVNNIKLDNVAATGKVDAIAGKTADLDDVTAAGKLNVNAKDADVKTSKGAEVLIQGTNSAIVNDVVATAGDLTAKAENSLTVDKVVAIKTNDTNGNIYLGSNGTINSLTADTATADTNLTIEAAGDINVTGLKADADNNNIGDLTINGKNITAKVGEGANVTISAAGTATVEDITAKAGNADIQSNEKLTAKNVKAVKTNANNGDVKLASNSDVDVNGATADKDVRVTGRDIKADGLTADAENNPGWHGCPIRQ